VSPAEESADTLVVRRLLPAPREQVFAAWLDPESLAQWMCPGDVSSVKVEVDPRVGGKLRFVMMRGENGVEHRGEYLIIEPPSRLSFTWISEFTDRLPSVVTIELLERGALTELVLTHRRVPDRNVSAHRKGWTDIVQKLEDTLAGRSAGD